MRQRSAPRMTAGARLAAGVMLLLVALGCWGVSRLLSETQRHSYDSAATPAATYQVTAGRTYQLSSQGGLAALQRVGVLGNGIALNCLSAAEDGSQTPLTLLSTKDDVRDLHVFATWRATQSGRVHISCAGVGAVFLDDADNSPPDYSAPLTVLTAVLGAAGVIACASGAYGLRAVPSEAQS